MKEFCSHSYESCSFPFYTKHTLPKPQLEMLEVNQNLTLKVKELFLPPCLSSSQETAPVPRLPKFQKQSLPCFPSSISHPTLQPFCILYPQRARLLHRPMYLSSPAKIYPQSVVSPYLTDHHHSGSYHYLFFIILT